jgi:integrase/recombinase XerD
MRTLKHLPENEWPEADRQAFRAAYEPGDIFDETAGPGAHLAESSRKAIKFAYRRWLGFLKANYADDLSAAPPKRITPERVRAFIEHLSAQIKPTSVAITVAHLYSAAGLIAPTTDWAWLRSVKSRLECLARPEDRFDRLVPPVETLDHGIELWTQPSRCLPATVTSNAKFNTAMGCYWPWSPFGRYADAASRP